MERSIEETIAESLEKIRDVRLPDEIHNGHSWYLTGYAAALMHARVIGPKEWGEIRNQREAAEQFWKENRI